jgi:UDP-N-acetylmuramoyl-tripeptide--D-alanyl-D-alanine ligase
MILYSIVVQRRDTSGPHQTVNQSNHQSIFQKPIKQRRKQTLGSVFFFCSKQRSCGKIIFNDIVISSNLVGVYNAHNILAALTIGLHFGVEVEKIKQAIENYIPSNNRSQILKTGKNTLILDCYNANPSSCKSAIESFANLNAERKMIFMGAMKELGTVSESEHKAVFDLMNAKGFERIVLVGKEYQEVAEGRVEYFSSSEELKEYLLENRIENATILIKGSRSTKMEVLKDVL